MAIVVSPHRFPTKRQFWAYCGLAVITESSGDFEVRNGRVERRRQPLTRGLRHGNNMMKNVFKGAARNIVLNRSGEFYADYLRLRAANMNFAMATLTIARKLAATILSMWKHKKEYSAEQHRAARK
jgi:transposase